LAEFVGAMIGEREKRGFLVTAAREFSKSAKKYVENVAATSNIELSLISFAQLFDMLRIANESLSEVWSSLVQTRRTKM
jgi:hypothetical protein